MSGQRDQAGMPNPPDQGARSTGWRGRAERAHGRLCSDSSWALSASEIGVYTFCRQAWFLDRCRLPVAARTEALRRWGVPWPRSAWSE